MLDYILQSKQSKQYSISKATELQKNNTVSCLQLMITEQWDTDSIDFIIISIYMKCLINVLVIWISF